MFSKLTPMAYWKLPRVDQVAWLRGCWEMQTREGSIEAQWLSPRASSMLGVSRTIHGTLLADYEMDLIRERGDRLSYEANPSNGEPSLFLSTAIGDRTIAFENLKVQFPSRLGFALSPTGRLTAWSEGELDRAIAIWDSILRAHPHDVVAFRLAHFVNFWLGRPLDMVASVERVIPAWSQDIPGYSMILACRCFAQEEAGNYLGAEPAGRRAIELDPGDLWAAHAVGHVMEMQGRRSEGIEWLTALAPNWEGSHNLQHHLWWHLALFKLEQGEFAEVLELYDTRFRDLAAPLTVASPDVYIDVQNAAATLFRLHRLGVDVGDRWEELADKAEARIGDCVSAFTLPHWMMALTATGRTVAAERMVEAMRSYASGRGTVPPIVRDYVLPIARAQLAHAAGRHAEAVELMRPAIGGMYRLGGSHAQQDVLEQLFVDAALKAGSTADVRLALERVTGRRAIPPERFAGWREAATRAAVEA